jgi:hypothetical protein
MTPATIYKIEFKVGSTTFCYVGATKQSLDSRFQQHKKSHNANVKRLMQGNRFEKRIFALEILPENATDSEICKREEFWIRQQDMRKLLNLSFKGYKSDSGDQTRPVKQINIVYKELTKAIINSPNRLYKLPKK